MDIGEIISDSLTYPISDWTKILILGIITVISNIGNITGTFTQNWGLTAYLTIIGAIIGLLVTGYLFRIIKSSIAGIHELPDFDAWLEMFIDGIKVTIVGIIYSLPAIIIILIFAASIILSILTNSPVNSAIAGTLITAGIGILIAILYMLIITPIIAMAVANMAYNNSKLKAAFKFNEILKKISVIGWGDLIIWYLVVGIVFIILAIIGGAITGLFSLISPIITIVLSSLIVTPFLQIYLARSVALFYSSE